jgi:hypothetical protein
MLDHVVDSVSRLYAVSYNTLHFESCLTGEVQVQCLEKELRRGILYLLAFVLLKLREHDTATITVKRVANENESQMEQVVIAVTFPNTFDVVESASVRRTLHCSHDQLAKLIKVSGANPAEDRHVALLVAARDCAVAGATLAFNIIEKRTATFSIVVPLHIPAGGPEYIIEVPYAGMLDKIKDRLRTMPSTRPDRSISDATVLPCDC